FGGVERLYENLPLVSGKLRETLAAGRKDALLSRELAVLRPGVVDLAFDLESYRRVEPAWPKPRGLWMGMEFVRLGKGLPAPVPALSGEPVEALSDAAALSAYLSRVPDGAHVAVDWAGEHRPPSPRVDAIGLFHPAAGAAWTAVGEAALDLAGRPLIVHD